MCAGMTHQPLIKAHIHNQMKEKELKQIKEELEEQKKQAEGKVESLKEMIEILEDKLKWNNYQTL